MAHTVFKPFGFALAVVLLAAVSASAADRQEPSLPDSPAAAGPYTAPGGMRVCLTRTQTSAFTTAIVIVPFGESSVPEKFSGGARLLGKWIEAGTIFQSEREFKSALGRNGAQLSTLAQPDRTVFLVSVPNRDASLAVRMLLHLVFSAKLDATGFERSQGFSIQDVSMHAKFPAFEFRRRASAVLFPGHPLARDPGGSAPTLKACTPLAIRSLYNLHFAPRNAVLVVAGNTDRRSVDKALQNLPSWVEPPEFGPVEKPLRLPPVRDRVIPWKSSREGYALVGFVLQKPAGVQERMKLAVASELLLGLSGRVTRELRNRRGLVYAPVPLQELTAAGGLWGAMVSVPAARAAEARDLLKTGFLSLASRPPTDDELNSARNAVGILLARVWEQNDLLAIHAAHRLFYGLPVTSYADDRKVLEQIQPQDMAKFAAECLNEDNLVTAVTD